MRNSALREVVRDYCKMERQWPRHLRIAHYRQRMKQEGQAPVSGAFAVKFWRMALELNGARP